MEEHRLKPMPSHYDLKLFEELYAKTDQLRKKLAWQIDCRRFGVDYKEVLSWFDVKFIHAFHKYHDNKTPELLKAHILQSLQFFKCRILRGAYAKKSAVINFHNSIEITEAPPIPDDQPEFDDRRTLLELAQARLRETLSLDAYRVFLIDLHPPLYIVNWLSENGKDSTTKIPSKLVAEYLGWTDNKAINKVNLCRDEINSQIVEAREFFYEYGTLV